MIKKIRYYCRCILGYRFSNFHFPLFFETTALSVISIPVIHSANDSYTLKQISGVLVGILILIFFSLISYKYIAKSYWILYIINIAILSLVLFAGISVNGARRWFSLGGIGTLQPSEFGKFFMILFLAGWISDNKARINKSGFLILTGVLFGLPLLLILKEPDLSTTVVYVFVFCTMIFAGGLSYKIVIRAAAAIVPTGILLFWYICQPFQTLLEDYQVQRIMTFLNPSEYMMTTYTQQFNSVMAIGSGMLTGKGLNSNALTSVKRGNFISEPQTDFIFAVIGEELGFIGSCIIIVLLFAVVIECLRIAGEASDMTGRLIAVGTASVVGFQTFVNIGVATALLPNTGLPLPFISYGLSSYTSLMMGVALILNVGLQQNRR